MASAELRYIDAAKTKQELVVLCSAEEETALDTKSGELTRKHYTDGVTREVCDSEWRLFLAHLFGWPLVQRFDEVLREGLSIRFIESPPV